jgi:hypothetical protein
MKDIDFKVGELLYVSHGMSEALVQLEAIEDSDEIGYHVLVDNADVPIQGSRGIFIVKAYPIIARVIIHSKGMSTGPAIDLVDLHDAGLSHTCSREFRDKMATFIREQYPSPQPEAVTTPSLIVTIPIAIGSKVWWRSSIVVIENVTIDHYIVNAESLHAVIRRDYVSSPANRYHTVKDLSLLNEDITKLI